MIGDRKSVSLSGRCIVVHERDNPTTAFYLQPLLHDHPDIEVAWHRFESLPPVEAFDDATVIFVRYMPARWRHRIEEIRPRVRRLVVLMDDDLLDIHATRGLPLRYRLKILRLATWHRTWLAKMRAELWVSTPYLVEKYAALGACLLPPRPLVELPSPPCVFCHATASHRAELEWLHPVVQQVLARRPDVVFELTGGRSIARLYRNIPQVTVTPPMPWPAFRRFSAAPGRSIGLAPVLDTPFNRARSPTRFFDITRAGAVGLYSDTGPCRFWVRNDVEGLLVPNEPMQWASAISDLLEDEPRRLRLLAGAQARVARLASGEDA